MSAGKIIFLNGVTSSGKSTISKAIQEAADEQFYHISNDMFFTIEHQMLHNKYIEQAGEKAKDKYMAEAIVLMYHFAKAVAEQGRNIIIDGMLEECDGFIEYYKKTNYDILLSIFEGFDILMVEVYCPLDECRRRNIARGDRGENQSQEQHDIMNKNIRYDLSVDTSVDDAKECADKIIKALYRTNQDVDNGCLICERINMIKSSENPYFVCELETGYVVIGDHQHFYGYSLFLYKEHITELHYIPKDIRQKHLDEMSIVYEDVFNAFKPEKMNCELLGNGDAHVHWHLFPRNSGDTPQKGPVWLLPMEEMFDDSKKLNACKLEEAKNKLRHEIELLLL